MYLHNLIVNNGSSLFVSVNSMNQYVATASIDGNICIRSMHDIRQVYDNAEKVQSLDKNLADLKDITDSKSTTQTTNPSTISVSSPDSIPTSKFTKPQFETSKCPELDSNKILAAQKVLNIVGVRSRSKITSLKYANLTTNANLLAAVYKNGEVYIITNPQDVNKCRIQQIFKHVNGLLLDFCWSADDQLMAFTSMNNEVILYDVIYGKMISNLHLHENIKVSNPKDGSSEEISIPVKGVTFDKVHNNLLFTLGDDKVLHVVKYNLVHDEYLGRKFEYSIIQDFNGIINSAKLNKATIKKISISPDDKLIACPNTSKSKTMKISLVSRGKGDSDWKLTKELSASGYKCFMTLFSPCIYKNYKEENFYLLASLSTDSALSIWRTDMHVPLYVITDLTPPVLDFCWSSDGSYIFLTLQNGNMMVVVLNLDMFGNQLYPNNELTLDLHIKTRDALPLEFERMTEWRSFLNDHPELVKEKAQEVLDEETKKIKVRPLETKSAPPSANNQSTSNPSSKLPVVTNTEKGVENNKENQKNVSDKEKQQNIIDKEKQKNQTKEAENIKEKESENEKNKVLDKMKQKEKETKSKHIDKNKSQNSVKNDKAKELDKSKITARENKDKTIKSPNTETSTNKDTKKPSAVDKSEKENSKKRPLATSNYDLPSNSVPKDLNAKVVKMMKKDSSQSTNSLKKKRDVDPTEFIGSVVINPQISFSNVRIATPKLRTNITYKLPDDESLRMDIKNGNGLESQPTRISLSKDLSKGDNKQLFLDFIPQKIHVICGSPKYWALATSTGQILTYSQHGRRVLPALVLGSPLSFLEMKDSFLLAVTSIGELYVWNLDEKKSIFKPISLYPLLQPLYSSGQALATSNFNTSTSASEKGDNVGGNSNVNIDSNGLVFVNGELLTRSENLTMCSVTSQGIPIVTLSNGNGYLFNKEMNVWSLISDSWWAFGSQYWDTSISIDSLKNVGLLEYMESHTNEEIDRKGKAKFFSKVSKMMLMREGYESLETVISLNHLENKINFYLFLKDYKNYKTFLIMYAKRLSELNLKNRLLEIFQSLFVDVDGEICGHSKKGLLEELLLSCSKHREVQHILVQYSESIGLLPEANDSDIDIL